LLIVGSAPAIAKAAGVFVATVAGQGGSADPPLCFVACCKSKKGHNQGQAVPQEKLTSYLVLMIS
jgi:hypothetical protein